MTDARQPFAFRDFRYFWTARLCSTLAQNSLVVVIGWQVYGLARASMGIRHAALQLGLIGLAQFLPLFVLTLVAGWVADRHDRRRVAQACIALQLLCAAGLALSNWLHALSLPMLFTVAVALGVARAFSMPALSALAPNVVPRTVVPRAIAANSIATRLGAVLGPALGGYLYAGDAALPYTIAALLLAVSFVAMGMLHPIEPTALTPGRKPWQQMLEGLEYVRHNPLVLGAISLDLFAVLLGGATALLPVYAQDILHVGAAGLGNLRAAPAIGAVAAAFWFSWRPVTANVGIKMLAAVAIYGVATVVFGLSRSMILSLTCLALLGAADMLSVYVRQSLVQLGTPNEMRGRVGAISTLFISASNELGEAESGFAAALVGPTQAVVLGGVGAMIVASVWAHLFPALRSARTIET